MRRPEHVAAEIRLQLRNPSPFTDPLTGEVIVIAKPAEMGMGEFSDLFAHLDAEILRERWDFLDLAGHHVRPAVVERATLEITYVEADR